MLKDCNQEEVQRYYHEIMEYITDHLLDGGIVNLEYEEVHKLTLYLVLGEINERLKIIEKILDIKD